MKTPPQIFVIASHVQFAKERIAQLAGIPNNLGTVILPILNDADMRGRVVNVGDLVLVAGDWSGVSHDRVKRLVDMFNTRRDVGVNRHEIPLLRYKPGEAPEVGYPNPPDPMSRENYPVLTTHTATTNTSDPVVVQTLNGNQFTFGVETSIPPDLNATQQISTYTDVEVQELLQELEDARALIKVNDKLVTAMSEQYQQLQSWLSGVQPVEDPDIPGLYFCGVCGHRLGGTYEHLDGCPAAPTPSQ